MLLIIKIIKQKINYKLVKQYLIKLVTHLNNQNQLIKEIELKSIKINQI